MSTPSSTSKQGRGYRLVARTVLTTATAAAFIGVAGVSASAAPNNTGSVTANVNVSSTITLALDQGSFNLNLAPSSSVDKTGAVTGAVTTNNLTGYAVAVQAEAASLQPSGGHQPGLHPDRRPAGLERGGGLHRPEQHRRGRHDHQELAVRSGR